MKIWPEFADEKTINFRMANCNICDKNKLGICQVCKCVVQFKTRLKAESCPLDKWPAQRVVWPNQA